MVLMLEALREGKARSYAQPYFHLRGEVSHWCRHEDCGLGLGSGRDSENVMMGMLVSSRPKSIQRVVAIVR